MSDESGTAGGLKNGGSEKKPEAGGKKAAPIKSGGGAAQLKMRTPQEVWEFFYGKAGAKSAGGSAAAQKKAPAQKASLKAQSGPG